MKKKKKTRKGPKKKLRKWLKKSVFSTARLAAFFLLLPLMVGLSIGGFIAFARSVPSITELTSNVTPPSTRLYADDDILIGELKILKGKHVALDRIPQDLISAVVSVEDAHFWEHSGVDYLAILRAAIKDILKRHLKEGGSTITQQLAKITFLTPEKTFKRKLKEFVLAQKIEKNLSKREILEIYLNRVYFGHGAYGVEMASRVYFDKSVKDLTLPEASLVAGLLKAPSSYSPFRKFKKAKNRQAVVLRRMEEEGVINRTQLLEAKMTPIYLSDTPVGNESDNYFIEYVKRYLFGKYGDETVYKGGLRVYTTMDRNAQAAAQSALRKGLRNLDKRRGWRGPLDNTEVASEGDPMEKVLFRTLPPVEGDILTGQVISVEDKVARIKFSRNVGNLSVKDAAWAKKSLDEETLEHKWVMGFTLKEILKVGDIVKVMVKSIAAEDGRVDLTLEQDPEVQGALVAIESHSGFIRALVGGYDFKKSEFNRALYANRQVGSAFKPVIYTLALKRGYTPASVIVDEEIMFETEPDDIWIPRNYDEEFHGPTRLRDALAYSRNVVTVRLFDEIGIERIMKFSREVGITGEMPRDMTLSLGSMCTTPLELTSVYGVYANNGMKMNPIGIKYITDRRGRVIESNEPGGNRVLDSQTSFLLTSMMKDVVNYGTGWRARALKRPVAGKTGTTNDYRDAWFMGYSTEIVAGVWIGFDDVRPLGPEETGSRAAAPVWVDFMKEVTDGTEPQDFPVPDGIVKRLIDPATGLLANRWTENTVLEYFREGTEPTKYSSSIWQTNGPDALFDIPLDIP
jgi:penicillin-binding protein 1A